MPAMRWHWHQGHPATSASVRVGCPRGMDLMIRMPLSIKEIPVSHPGAWFAAGIGWHVVTWQKAKRVGAFPPSMGGEPPWSARVNPCCRPLTPRYGAAAMPRDCRYRVQAGPSSRDSVAGNMIRFRWLPRMDSNHRMSESESDALPLGDGAIRRLAPKGLTVNDSSQALGKR